MAKIILGFLFKRRSVTFKNKKQEYFEFLDYVPGITFINKDDENIFHVLSGKYMGEYANDLKEGSSDFVFLPEDLEYAIEKNDNTINYNNIRKIRMANCIKYKYYVRDKSGKSLERPKDKDFLTFLEKRDNKGNSGFYEEEFEKTSDISTMYASIKKTIISQDEQIMQILTALFKNQRVINSSLDIDTIAKLKENILVFGSTGTGKTEILKRISKLYNVPIVIEDATSLSETGYEGRDVVDMLDDLFHEADCNLDNAEKGILVIDEFDKLAEKSEDHETHVSRLGVQRSLLKLLDGATFYLDDTKFDTSKLTIVVLGAFTGITIGDDYKNITTKDFIDYGIIRELIGRFSKTIAMNPLTKEDIIKILKESDFSPLYVYKKLFDLLGVGFNYDDEFVEYIADIAISKESGARSLKTVVDECIGSALFKIFAGEYSDISLVKPQGDDNPPYVLTKKVHEAKKSGFFGRNKKD